MSRGKQVEFEVVGDRTLLRKFFEMRRRASDMRPLWPEFLVRVRVHNELVFARQGPQGRKWKPLSPPYARWKVARVGLFPILQFSGAMKRSVTSTPMDIERLARKRVTWGSKDRKAVWHQFGTSRDGKPVVPARPFLLLTRPLIREARAMIIDYVTEPFE